MPRKGKMSSIHQKSVRINKGKKGKYLKSVGKKKVKPGSIADLQRQRLIEESRAADAERTLSDGRKISDL